MNGIVALTLERDSAVIVDFCERPEAQVLLLSAGRNAAGLALTAARHVIILEPQPEHRSELQMVGRVHRIGQQVQVHRFAVAGSDEQPLCEARQALGKRDALSHWSEDG